MEESKGSKYMQPVSKDQAEVSNERFGRLKADVLGWSVYGLLGVAIGGLVLWGLFQ